RLVPASIEFWRSRPFRLHERLAFTRAGETWTTQRLFP
ncbi:MAG TPA: pyridoxine 5'-phosphate oxidase C-terminal domain-containing protein, partial [Caulobacteraceae bacterium]|nr:pyridoxine 5'-phosphate oxidase C-terminal domain-containing protein [Caulobacteraceae bacterium]